MKTWNRIFILACTTMVLIFIGTNLYFIHPDTSTGRPWLVEIERACLELSTQGNESLDLSQYPFIVRITSKPTTSDSFFYNNSDHEYVIRKVNGILYRFDYRTDTHTTHQNIWVINLVLGLVSLGVLILLLFVRSQLLKPFYQLREVPYELSRGNLSVSLKENKSHFFGRFVWGIDLLREHLEEQKKAEHALQKEKKTLILSISHDIKTPLSAIKLYARALSQNLYDSPTKQLEIAENINAKANEIENFITQIIQTSSEDFLNLEVSSGEFYLSELMEQIHTYYNEKLTLLKISFHIASYSDCILCGDQNRAVEVLQNLMENAIKYGNGKDINIAFAQEEDCQLVTVSNNGCELAETEMPHIFDSFWRGSNASHKDGSGLGLYICRQLMNKMGGEIFASHDGDCLSVTCVFQKA